MKNKFSIPLFLLIILISCEHESLKRETLITIKGSDSELNLIRVLSEKFKNNSNPCDFNLTGGGSTKGILALMNNETDIANSSRVLNESEENIFKTKGKITYPFLIASDIVCIISNSENGVDSLSINQLSDVFKGVVLNWKELGGNDFPIKIFGRDGNSATRSYLQRVLSLGKMSEYHINFESNNEIINAVEKEKGAIGYVNIGSLLDKNGKPFSNVWAMNIYGEGIPSCSPYETERIRNGEYILTRALIQYITNPKKEILQFIRFELGAEQQIELENHGYLKLNSVQSEINNRIFDRIKFD